MNNLVRFSSRVLEVIVVAVLTTMSCLVFLNVVLRYGFNSSINITEEVARYLFVWLTFLGAVLAFNDGQHVKVTMLTAKLSAAKQRLLSLLTDGLMLFCCYLMLSGSWVQFQLNLDNIAPISGIPTGVTYFAGVVAAALIGVLLILRLVANMRTILEGEAQ